MHADIRCNKNLMISKYCPVIHANYVGVHYTVFNFTDIEGLGLDFYLVR